MTDVVIVSACRTPIGTFGGTLRDVPAARLAAVAMEAAVTRAGIPPTMVDDVRFGCCMEPADSLNVARVAALMAGIPETATAATVNRVCISGMEAVVSAMAMIETGMADVVLAGGVEQMSSVAYELPSARWGARMNAAPLIDALTQALHCGSHHLPLADDSPVDLTRAPASMFVGKPYLMGHTAEFLAQHLDIPRSEMDALALRSHANAEQATNDGRFQAELVPVPLPPGRNRPASFEADEHFRPGLTLGDLERLAPAFVPDIGTVTVGNASGINDGAAAMVLMSETRAKENNIPILARIRAVGRGGCHPSVMGLSPVPAVRNLLDRSGMSLTDFDLIELNEAFAAQYLACERQLGLDRDRTNISGSGIGLGHPVGATGARILVTLVHALRRRQKNLGLATLCGGGGVAMACAVDIDG